MNTKPSRLPRAASNPIIRPPSSSIPITSRLPAPVRLVRQTTVTRKPSIPLRANRKITPTDITKVDDNNGVRINPAQEKSTSKRLLPSRSILGLTSKSSISAPQRSNINHSASPLGPKRTISTGTAQSKHNAKSSFSKKSSPATIEVEPKKTIFHSTSIPSINKTRTHRSLQASPEQINENIELRDLLEKANPLKPFNLLSAPKTKKYSPRTGFLGLGSPSRRQTPTTPLSRQPSSSNAQTPVLPRIASIPWIAQDPDEQLKDLDLSFNAEDESHDDSFIEPLDFGFATSRFAPRPSEKSSLIIKNDEKRLQAEIEEYKLEKERLVRELRGSRNQGVKEAWSEVVRAGEGDLEEVRHMLEVVESMKADLDRLQC
ncbi:uncharacterized protein L201_007357 [Kwoniella dendrophila CBS 6074]|uniref:Uncharacterized protein n=1 Tax=Kwoniella dendrophila CBS 6074 TaxID=1295534 RepID=A0AAX4K6E5_9TREE